MYACVTDVELANTRVSWWGRGNQLLVRKRQSATGEEGQSSAPEGDYIPETCLNSTGHTLKMFSIKLHDWNE